MKRFLLLLPVCAALVVVACGDDDDTSDDGTSNPTNDAGQDGSHAGHDAAKEDSGGGAEDASIPLKCTDSELAANTVADGGEVVIQFATNESTAQYTNHCLTVKVGSSVKFVGSFLNHALEPAGGDEPTPIKPTSTNQPDNTLTIAFPNAGTFGYRCEYHPTSMFGAIRVVP